MASKDPDQMTRSELLAAVGETGLPFDAGSHDDQLRATLRRSPLLLEEHNRRAMAEAGADVPPVSVDPGPDPETGFVKQRGEVGTNSETRKLEAELPAPAVPPAQLAENRREGAQTGGQPDDPQAGEPANPRGGTVQHPNEPGTAKDQGGTPAGESGGAGSGSSSRSSSSKGSGSK